MAIKMAKKKKRKGEKKDVGGEKGEGNFEMKTIATPFPFHTQFRWNALFTYFLSFFETHTPMKTTLPQ